jgi:hypothetical protein
LKTEHRYGRKTKVETKATCHFCHKPGHFKENCFKFRAQHKKEQEAAKIATQTKSNDRDDEAILRTQQYCFKTHCEENGKWYADSGVTCHLINSKLRFNTLSESEPEIVRIANGDTIKTRGVGNLYLNCKNDKGKVRSLLITDVHYVPELNGNVLSVRALTKKGISWKFDGEKCAVMQRNDSVATADSKQQLYELNCTHKAKLTGFAKNDNCLHTLHRRFGHSDPNSIKLLEKKCLVSGMYIGKCNKTILCDTFIQRKMEILPLPKVSTTKRKSMFDLEHRDWCGQIETQTPGGK